MERYYTKNDDGTFVEAGFGGTPDLYDGIWLVQSRPGQRSTSGLVWRVGDLKRPADITTYAAFYSIIDEVAGYIVNLHEPDSDEFIDAKENSGCNITGDEIGVYNISASDYASLILTKIATFFEEAEDHPSLYEITREFTSDNPDFWKLRDKLEKYLRENNYIIKKKHK